MQRNIRQPFIYPRLTRARRVHSLHRDCKLDQSFADLWVVRSRRWHVRLLFARVLGIFRRLYCTCWQQLIAMKKMLTWACLSFFSLWCPTTEIMFGTIDLMTLLFLYCFYREQSSRGFLTGRASFVIFRVLYISSVTFLATVVAIVINTQIPSIGLTSSIVDITTDIVSMIKIYSKPSVQVEIDWDFLASCIPSHFYPFEPLSTHS